MNETNAVAMILLCLASLAASGASPTIVVNFGPYESAQKAASDEANVNWSDADLSDDVACTECFAATELRHYLCLMTGMDENDPKAFAIVRDDRIPDSDLILVGGPQSNAVARRLAGPMGLTTEQLSALGPEGYALKTASVDGRKVLLIAGGGRVGTLYGVYDFLYRLGVRWFGPGEVNEDVPALKLDRLPDLDVVERPAFVSRGFWSWEERGNDEFLLWMARNRMNFWCVDTPRIPLIRKLGIQMTCGGHQHQSRFLDPQSRYPYNHARFDKGDAKPADPYPISAEYAGDANGDGVLSYSEAHPEWYGLHGGKRSFNIRGSFGDNFCTSNQDAVTEFFKNMVQDLIDGQWREADSINFWMLDNGRWCECEPCKALGTPTDRNLLLVHGLRQEILKARAEGRLQRDVRVIFLAYADVIEPPTRPLPEDFDYVNCTATFFPIRRCYVHGFDAPECKEYNARYLRHYTGWALDPKRHYRGQIFIGEYYNVSRYKCLPIVFHRVMAHDIPYYYRTGARHMHYMHVTTGNWGNKCLTNYQFARMLWDPNLDAEALLDDYLKRRYGPAAQTMRQFYEHLEQALCNVTELKYVLAPALEANAENLFPHNHLQYDESHPETNDGPTLAEMVRHVAECRRLIDQVRGQVLPDKVGARTAEDERVFAYAENTLHLYDHVVQATRLLREGQIQQAKEQYLEAVPYAEALREDTTSASMSSSHASAPDGLSASLITNAYERLRKEFGGPTR